MIPATLCDGIIGQYSTSPDLTGAAVKRAEIAIAADPLYHYRLANRGKEIRAVRDVRGPPRLF
jgi:hypothetical protein